MLFFVFSLSNVFAFPIVGGQETNAMDSVGALMSRSVSGNESVFCSATMIHPEWLLTAGHCLTGLQTKQESGDTVYFSMGANALNPEERQLIHISETRIHPDYNIDAMLHDIGLIKLAQPVYVADIPQKGLQEPQNDWMSETLYFVGYGSTSDSLDDFGLKRDGYIDFYAYDDQFIYVLDPNGLVNLCTGDSGGPAFQINEYGVPVIVGVNSFVFQLDESIATNCISGGAGATRVDRNVEWILSLVPNEWEDPAIVDINSRDEKAAKATGCLSATNGFEGSVVALSLLVLCFRRQRSIVS